MFINVLIPYLKEHDWTLSLCVIFARSLLMLHVISCCTTLVTRISLLHLPCGHFAPTWPWIYWILGPPPAWLWPISWVDCGFFHSVTMSLFLGGLWVLHQRDRDFFLCTFLVDCGSFTNMTMICFLELSWWIVGTSTTGASLNEFLT